MAFPKEYDAKLLAERQRQRDMQRQHILKSFFISDYMLTLYNTDAQLTAASAST
jgi:hypothetical protein